MYYVDAFWTAEFPWAFPVRIEPDGGEGGGADGVAGAGVGRADAVLRGRGDRLGVVERGKDGGRDALPR